MTANLGQVPGSLMDWAAGVIGISPAIVRAQINDESGGNPGAVSSAGAQGVAQFIPSTWSGEGCTGSPFNVSDSMKCYAKYMYQLVQQYHGNVRNALAAYNAGQNADGSPRSAGYGYADAILAAAGQPASVKAGGGTGANAAAAGTSTTAADQTAAVGATADPSCAWGIHGGIPVLGSLPVVGSTFSVDVCFIRKTTIRHVVGGLLLGAGFLIMLPGVAIVIAAGFRSSGAAQAVVQSAQAVPGYGRVARRMQAPARTAS